jgi:uncharacterized protein YqeY
MKEKIQKDLWLAIKEKDEIKISVLRLVLNEISKKEVEKRYLLLKKEPSLKEEELTQKTALEKEEIFKIIISEIKKRKEAIENFKKAKREDLILKEEKEIEVLKEYLPPQLSEEDLEKIVRETIKELSGKELNFGLLMKEVLKKVSGQADPSLVSQLIKKILEEKK